MKNHQKKKLHETTKKQKSEKNVVDQKIIRNV